MVSTEQITIPEASEISALLNSSDLNAVSSGVATLLNGEADASQYADRLKELKSEVSGGVVNMPLGVIVEALLDACGIEKYNGDNPMVFDVIEKIKTGFGAVSF